MMGVVPSGFALGHEWSAVSETTIEEIEGTTQTWNMERMRPIHVSRIYKQSRKQQRWPMKPKTGNRALYTEMAISPARQKHVQC
jgi:hypothetical protein